MSFDVIKKAFVMVGVCISVGLPSIAFADSTKIDFKHVPTKKDAIYHQTKVDYKNCIATRPGYTRVLHGHGYVWNPNTSDSSSMQYKCPEDRPHLILNHTAVYAYFELAVPTPGNVMAREQFGSYGLCCGDKDVWEPSSKIKH